MSTSFSQSHDLGAIHHSQRRYLSFLGGGKGSAMMKAVEVELPSRGRNHQEGSTLAVSS